MISVGDRVRIHRPFTKIDRAEADVIRIQEIAPRVGVVSSHQPISRLVTVRLDDGTVVEPPLLVSDLVRLPRH